MRLFPEGRRTVDIYPLGKASLAGALPIRALGVSPEASELSCRICPLGKVSLSGTFSIRARGGSRSDRMSIYRAEPALVAGEVQSAWALCHLLGIKPRRQAVSTGCRVLVLGVVFCGKATEHLHF